MTYRTAILLWFYDATGWRWVLRALLRNLPADWTEGGKKLGDGEPW